MAPEQFGPTPNVDALCDIFAYGEVYYELLAGRHPFETSQASALIYTEDPPPIQSLAPDCPETLQRVINRLLQKDRDLRYQNLKETQFDTQPILIELKQERAAILLRQAQRIGRGMW
jgi:serine/threonine-protein kinase